MHIITNKIIITSSTKSFDSNCHMFPTDAPSTLRIPISLTRLSATKDVNPNTPRQEMKTARTAKNVASVPILFSLPNFLANSSFAKSALNREAGAYRYTIYFKEHNCLHMRFQKMNLINYFK